MNINTRFKIINMNYYNYLKDNSPWIKELSRNSNNIDKFIDFIKEKYTLKFTDKIENITQKIDMISNVLSALK